MKLFGIIQGKLIMITFLENIKINVIIDEK